MGANINRETLESKFYPYWLGHAECKVKGLKEEMDTLFKQGMTKVKDYIRETKGWFVKGKRTDTSQTTPDTHIDRIWQAKQIREYIKANGFENDFVVPEKYLYWDEKNEEFFVVSKTLKLSNEVGKPATKEIENVLKSAYKHIPALKEQGGQVKALYEGKTQRELTSQQARALAKLTDVGYTDYTYNNLYFTKDGKVAIIDTENVKRVLNKAYAANWVFFVLGDMGSLLAQQAIAGMAKLKLCCNEAALKEVNAVEKRVALWAIAKLTSKIALQCLAIYVIPRAINLLPIGGAAAKALKVTLIGVTVLRTLSLTINLVSVNTVWNWSGQGLEGIGKIGKAEQTGAF